MRSTRSTPPVATTASRYLFQSCVRISAGAAPGCEGAEWTGMLVVRWYFAEDGVRRSKMRRCESEETAEMRAGLDGQKEAL